MFACQVAYRYKIRSSGDSFPNSSAADCELIKLSLEFPEIPNVKASTYVIWQKRRP